MPDISQRSAKKGLTKTHVILIIGFLVVIALIVFLFFYFNKKEEPAELGAVGIITEENLGEITDTLAKKMDQANFETYMSNDWSFPDGKSPSTNAIIGNSAANNYDFYFTVTLNDTGEEVYKSGLIPVGKTLAELKLNKELPDGTYSAICSYHLIDENGKEIESTLGFNVTLRIGQ